MPKPAGTPIWYELMTPDPDGAKRFYDAVVGWTVEAPPPGPVDYRMITAADGGHVGGMMRMTPDMLSGGARPAWLMYVHVEDVDATVAQARELGAPVFVPPTDIPGVGRFSLMADPQGATFYVMRPSGDGESTSFSPDGRPGRCAWNELSTTDLQSALAFYGPLFGWENRETMDMGPMGGYHFLDLGETRLGAMAEMKDRPAQWSLYFTVADIDASVARVREGGGAIEMGPMEVPGGQRIVLGRDPQGAGFALVS